MTSKPFQRALAATGYITPGGKPAPGLSRSDDTASVRLRPALSNDRVGLRADAVFSAHSTPTSIFKDAGAAEPTDADIGRWHEAAWNLGIAPLLWIVTPTEVRLYDCYSSPPRLAANQVTADPLGTFVLNSEGRMRTLDAMCGRLATETGAFWSSEIGSRINRRHRVDRELLAEIEALEQKLAVLPPKRLTRRVTRQSEAKEARDFAQRLIGRCIFTWYLLDRGIAQSFLPNGLSADLAKIFGTTKQAFKLFKWLQITFNGDLFPMTNPVAEDRRLSEAHLLLMQDFIEGRSLASGSLGQGRLFKFRFEVIPVELRPVEIQDST